VILSPFGEARPPLGARGAIRVLQCFGCVAGRGVGPYVADLVEALPEDEFEVGLCLSHPRDALPARLQAFDGPVADRSSSSQRTPRLIGHIRGAVRAFRPHIVHTHTKPDQLFARLALGRRSPVRLLSTFHSCFEHYFQAGSRAGAMERRVFSMALRWFPGHGAASSSAIAAEYERHFPGMGKVAVVWPAAACPAATLTSEAARLAFRQGLGLELETLGALGPWKNQLVLVEALAQCQAEGCDVHLLLAGGEETPGYGQLLRERAEALGIGPLVSVLGVRQDVGDLLAISDVWALTSRGEGISIAMLEAMAAGLPVVVTPVGDTEAAVKHEQTGLLVPVGDVDATAGALLRLIGDPGLRAGLGLAARETIEARFSPQRLAGEYAELYRSLVADR